MNEESTTPPMDETTKQMNRELAGRVREKMDIHERIGPVDREPTADEIKAGAGRILAAIDEEEQNEFRRGGLRSPDGVCYHDWVDDDLYVFNAKHEHQPIERCRKCGVLGVFHIPRKKNG
jgi:hypothetical protein